MHEDRNSQVLLTASDIKKLEDECVRLNAEIAEIDEKRREMERRRDESTNRLNRIRELMSELGLTARLQPAQATPESNDDRQDEHQDIEPEVEDDRRSPWPAEILQHLARGPYESLLSAELRQQVERGPLANLFRVSDKGYYHTIRRLALRRDITKAHGRLFTLKGLQEYEAALKAGGAPISIVPIVAPRKSPLADTIIDLVASCPTGVRGREVINRLLQDERFSQSIGRNNTGVYNVLSRLVRYGRLEKRGEVYCLPLTNEASVETEALKNPSHRGIRPELIKLREKEQRDGSPSLRGMVARTHLSHALIVGRGRRKPPPFLYAHICESLSTAKLKFWSGISILSFAQALKEE